MAAPRRARAFGFALLFTLPLLSACASVVPESRSVASAPPVATKPPPAPLGTPRPYRPRPSETGTIASTPIPATPNPPLVVPPVPVDATSAITAGVAVGPDVASLGVSPERASAALTAFRISCPSVQRRADTSGLTQNADWTESCAAAKSWKDTDAAAFFARYFATVQVGAGSAFVTGY